MVVMPVYNEQASIRKVLHEWFSELENWTEDFIFLAIDDGSKDSTADVLGRLKDKLGERLEILRQPNQGHGQSCLNGYRIAAERGIPFVFQIDSDGQCDPRYFYRFWRMRNDCDVIFGRRIRRDDGWRRVVASLVLKATLALCARVWCADANVPYRLMRTPAIDGLVNRMPKTFFLANVGLAVLLRRERNVRHGYVNIHFRERYGGEPSVRLGKFGSKAFELIRNLHELT